MKKRLGFFKKKSNNQSDNIDNTNYEPLYKDLKENIDRIKLILGNSSDILTREIIVGNINKVKIGVIYTDGLVNQQNIQEFILKTLMLDSINIHIDKKPHNKNEFFQIIKDSVITSSDLTEVVDFRKLLNKLLSGYAIVLIDGFSTGLAVDSKGWENRGVTEPSSETVVRGPKEAFNENIRINTSLIRRKIKDPNLWIESKRIGRRTETDIAIVYIKGVANDKVVKEVHERLDRIDIDGILESAYIEELIEDNVYTPFPTMLNSERPDVVAALLLEGRIAILVDGSPFVLVVPALFINFFQANEDYYTRFHVSSLLRTLRFLAFFLALLTPSLYIAVTSFHQEMIPTTLLISIAAQREGIPFPAFIEALIMEITFEILREAGVRLPRAVGSAVSIVGALVLGEAAVKASIVSPVMVIVVSITAISSFVFPSYNIAISIRMLRFLFMILGSTFGLYGISLGLIAMNLHLCSLRSFGIPYLSPLGPFIKRDQKDVVFRAPRHELNTRPSLISQRNTHSQQSPLAAKPKPPK